VSPELQAWDEGAQKLSVATWREVFHDLYQQTRQDGIIETRRIYNRHKQAAIAFVGDCDLEQLRQKWTATPARERRRIASTMIGCLVDSARRTLFMLALDVTFPRDWRFRCDCLGYLDMVYEEEINDDPLLKQLFTQQIERVSRIWRWPSDMDRSMPWQYVVLLLRHNSREHCENIIDTICENHGDIRPRTLLVMVDYLTKIGESDRAAEMLARIPPEEREEHKVRILERCANLISIDTIQESDSAGNFRILPKLIGLGLPMDARFHNCLLIRALDLGWPVVAWEMFVYMEKEGIPVDPNGYLRLLQDSFERDDRNKMDAIMSTILERQELYQYPYLVVYMMNIVRVVCTIDRKLPSETSVSHLLAIYDRAFDRAPLVKLRIADPLPNKTDTRAKLESPPPVVLGFTIWAYVLCQRDHRLVAALWFWILHLMKQQDESILACAKHDVMWNGFIHFYGMSRFNLSKGIDVIETMINHNLCTPTQRTWSEVLCVFLKHDQEDVATKLWKSILARDVPLTDGGWSFLRRRFDGARLSELVQEHFDGVRNVPGGIQEALSPNPKSINPDPRGESATSGSPAFQQVNASGAPEHDEDVGPSDAAPEATNVAV
jgi:hypothetical protein